MATTHIKISLCALAEVIADQVLTTVDGEVGDMSACETAAEFAEWVGRIVAHAVAPDDGSPAEHDARELFLSKYADRVRAQAKTVSAQFFSR